jgi:hypothetical protein
MRWYVATRQQYNHQFRFDELYRAGNLVSLHSGHLEVDEHSIATARCHQSESLFRRLCRENRVPRPFEERSLVAQDCFVVINA